MNSNSLGVYIHVPYCLQICPYCDFTKYALGKILEPENYVDLLIDEIRAESGEMRAGEKTRPLETLYFGGGTPSLLEPPLILSVLQALANEGFRIHPTETEVTLEIDPATVSQDKLEQYLKMGINRFSVGAQTFNDRLLKIAGRKHAAQDTVSLLSLLKEARVNYSFDLLFALPTQTVEELNADIATALTFGPRHLSAYCLTVPEGHPMAQGRAPEGEQLEMFDLLETKLADQGLLRYEISNFAQPGFESKHNLRYWTDQAYWGLGVSAHGYLPYGYSAKIDASARWGVRSWNAPSIQAYQKEVAGWRRERWNLLQETPTAQLEVLARHQALTDFCHTSLRLTRGLDENALRLKFGEDVCQRVASLLKSQEVYGLTMKTPAGWTLTREGRLIANSVFEKLTFLEGELTSEAANS